MLNRRERRGLPCTLAKGASSLGQNFYRSNSIEKPRAISGKEGGSHRTWGQERDKEGIPPYRRVKKSGIAAGKKRENSP